MNKQLRLFTNNIFSTLALKQKATQLSHAWTNNKLQQYCVMQNKQLFSIYYYYSISVSKILAYCNDYDY